MLAKLRSLITGAKRGNRPYKVAKPCFMPKRGGFERLEERQMLSANTDYQTFDPIESDATLASSSIVSTGAGNSTGSPGSLDNLSGLSDGAGWHDSHLDQEYNDAPILPGESREIYMPHHADAGHGGTPNTHFFQETGDAHHFAWLDRDLSTPNVIDIWYDFRAQNGFANSITAGQTQRALDALTEWENASAGAINFIQNAAAAAADIINIGTGNLAALGSTSAPGGTLGLGGGIYTHNANHTITGGVSWQDFAETWDEAIGNGNPFGTFDYYTVVAQEIGHALGLGHTGDLAGPDIMDGTYTAEFGPAPFSANDVAHISSVYADPLIVTSTVDDGELLGTLRHAIIFANALPGPATITLKAETYNLTLAGTGGANQGDLDITGNLTIVGAGAGLSVINAAGLNDRIFEVTTVGASLNAARLTLTGGNGGAGGGGAILADLQTTVDLNQVALVGNTTNEIGGAIRVGGPNTILRVRNSVITGNTAAGAGGGIAVYTSNPAHTSNITIGSTVLARNVDNATTYENIYSDSPLTNEGNNLLDSDAGGYFSAAYGDFIGPVDYVVTSMLDAVDANLANSLAQDAKGLTTLRAAVQEANDEAGMQTIWLPAWRHRLTVVGTGGANQGDFDITGNVTIRGAGAGLSVIDASGLNDRIFEIITPNVSLTAARLTLTGGNGGAGGGGAILADLQTTVDLNQVALVGNTTNEIGGAIRVGGPNTILRVRNSVITGNTAVGAGAGIAVYTTGPDTSNITIGSTVLARNVSNATTYENIYTDSPLTNEGNNLLDNDVGGYFSAAFGDYIGPVDCVVTSVADTFDNADNAYALSIREAIDAANSLSGTQEIWMPAWKFVLTRPRSAAPGSTDTDVTVGDLDIHQSLILRGVSGVTSVAWRAGITDKVFELLGDYNGDGIANGSVGSEDYTIWRDTLGSTSDLRADGDDNGVIQEADWIIWKSHFGNTLTRYGV